MLRPSGPSYDLRAAMSHELRDASAALADANQDPRALHRCRVHVKRARALARAGHACAPGLSAVFNDTARSLMHQLAPARDLSALGEAARKTAQRLGGKRAQALNEAAAQLDAERDAFEPLDLDSAQAGLKDLLALAMVWPEASPRQIKRGIERIVRRARDAYAIGRSAKQTEARHEWRKRAKDRHYAALLMGDAWPGRRRRKLSMRLGDVLGEERDLSLLIQRMKHAPDPFGQGKCAKRTLTALKKRRKQLARRAESIGARLHAQDS
ncbi:MAG: CHAD domain-containing protein [Hyphomonadaceae bacterium]|nr:CHAD domain-containing protein [Hyphomonadaceae bacterium]